MTNTKIYDNMTVTVTCNESEDIEMTNLIKKLSAAKELRENTEATYLPKIEAVGRSKWIAIATQLSELCQTAKGIGIEKQLGRFMYVFNRNNDGGTYKICLEWNPLLKIYQLAYGYADSILETVKLLPIEEYCPKDQLEDKDGWLAKWDEYDIYPRLREKLMREIQLRINAEESKTREIQERYAEFVNN